SKSFRSAEGERLIRLCDTPSCYASVKRLQFYVVFGYDRIATTVKEGPRIQIRAAIRQLRQRRTVGVGEDHELQVGPARQQLLGVRPHRARLPPHETRCPGRG